MNELSNDLTAEMIPEGLYRKIADAIGAKNFFALAEAIGGTTVYIPKAESLVRPIRDAHIKEEFNGYNHYELAKKYDVTVRWVQQLCGEGHPEGQMNLFENLGEPDSKKRIS
jgi:Uncharacterized conserved protein